MELKEALKQNRQPQKSAPIIIPLIIEECSIPKPRKIISTLIFTKGWAEGFSELIRGIYREAFVIKLSLNKNKPLELDTTNFKIWTEEFLEQKSPLFFVFDDLGLLEETSKRNHGPYYDEAAVSTDLRFSRILITNLCLVLPNYLKTLSSLARSDNYFTLVMPESIQRLCKLVMYTMFTKGIEKAFNDGLEGPFGSIKSVNMHQLIEDLEIINPGVYYEFPVFRINEANILNLKNPISIDLVGNKGIRNVCPLLLSTYDISDFVKDLWQLESFTTNEISESTWLKLCMPQIAAEHIIEISRDGKLITEHIETIGLKPNDYEKIGPH